MHGIDINLTTVAAIWMVGATAMIPLLGVAIRFAVVPLLDSVARIRRVELHARREAMLHTRISALESRLDELTRLVQRRADGGAINLEA